MTQQEINISDQLAIATRVAIAVKEINPIPLFKIWHTVSHHPDVYTLMPPLHIILKDDVLGIMKTLSINPNRFDGVEDYDLSDPATLLDQVFQDIGQSK